MVKTDRVKEFYSDDSRNYDKRWIKKGGNYTNIRQLQIIKQLTKTWNNLKILEIGCGSGRFSELLVQNNPEMAFMDLSNEMLEVTASKIGTAHEFINASVYQIPKPDQSVQAIISINVLNHVEDLYSALAEINRVLIINGELVINITNLLSYYFLPGIIVNLRKASIGRGVFSQWLLPTKFLSLIEKNGFEVTRIEGNVFVPTYLDIPVINDFLVLLDKVSSNTFLKYLSPALFIKCNKIKHVSELK